MSDITISLLPCEPYVNHIARELRPLDRQEIFDPANPVVSLWKAIGMSDWTSIAVDNEDGTPFCIWGIAPLDAEHSVGSPWMLATDRIRKHKRWVMETSFEALDHYHARYDVLVNRTLRDHSDSIRWLKRLGFQFDWLNEVDINGRPAVEFYRCVTQ